MEPKLASDLEIRPIVEVESWHAIAGEWDTVLRATRGYTPLQSFDFLATWWQHLAGERRLWILAFRAGGRLVGIAPLQITPRKVLGGRYRVLEFIGMTEDILVPNLLFPDDRAAELRAAFIDYLAAHRTEWDLIELDELPADSALLADFARLAERCRLIHRQPPFHDCPFVDLAGATPKSFWAARSSKLLKNVRAAERKLRGQGEVTMETYASADDVGEGFREFLEIEQRSWKRKAAVGFASDRRYEAFYGRLLEVFAARHGARVLILAVGGRPIAGTLAIVFDGIYCSLQIVHDEAYARYSPGTLLEYYEMNALLESGAVRRYEFLGGALTNKLRWTSDATATACVRARKADLRTRLLDAYEFLAKPLAKRVLRRARLL